MLATKGFRDGRHNQSSEALAEEVDCGEHTDGAQSTHAEHGHGIFGDTGSADADHRCEELCQTYESSVVQPASNRPLSRMSHAGARKEDDTGSVDIKMLPVYLVQDMAGQV